MYVLAFPVNTIKCFIIAKCQIYTNYPLYVFECVFWASAVVKQAHNYYPDEV